MVKFFIFFLFILAAILRALVWPPKIVGDVSVDHGESCLTLELRTKRTLRPIQIYGINFPTDYKTQLSASPPDGFTEQQETYVPGYRYDGELRELHDWNGSVTVKPKQTLKIQIPVKNLRPLTGTIQVCYEVYLGVGSLGSWSFIPFDIVE